MNSTMPKSEYLQGALDLLILKTLALGPNHGWGIQQRVGQVTAEKLTVSQGSLYPALHRLEAAGMLHSEMAPSENNRRARFYRLTVRGRKQLETETDDWQNFSVAMRRLLQSK
jgi:PadR family transcriptional regulator, regulatory protein PadR